MDVNIRRSPEGRSGAGIQRKEKQEYTSLDFPRDVICVMKSRRKR
jgi:hypothetical protein